MASQSVADGQGQWSEGALRLTREVDSVCADGYRAEMLTVLPMILGKLNLRDRGRAMQVLRVPWLGKRKQC